MADRARKRRPTPRRTPRRRGWFGAKGNRRITAKDRPVTGELPDVAADAPKAVNPEKSSNPAHAVREAARFVLRIAVKTVVVLVVLSLLTGIGFGGYVGYQRVARSGLFDVQRIVVTGVARTPKADVLRHADKARGQGVLSVDIDAIGRTVAQLPWVATANVRRVLPSTLVIEITERAATAALLMGHIYLVDAEGAVFKRATTDEADGLTVITGVARLSYLNDRAGAQKRIQRALDAVARYRTKPRPALSEVNVGAHGDVSMYLRRGGVALRFGRELSEAQLARLDAVWLALGPDTRRARAVFLDSEVRRNRVVVRMGAHE